MSSIISDIFYGSKQAILDNYLIQQHNQPSVSSHHQPNDHTHTVSATPFIEFHVSAQQANQLSSQQLLVTVEMGRHTDSAWMEVDGRQSFHVPTVGLVLNEVDRDEIKKYTNVRLALSRGQHRAKVTGFIPIQTLKLIANSYPHEKSCIVQLRGRQSIGISQVQCFIRMHSDKILNSELMGSVQYQSQQSRADLSHSSVPRSRPSRQKIRIEEAKEDQRSGVVEFVKLIGEIQVVVVKVDLLEGGQVKDLTLRCEQSQYELGQTLTLKNIQKQGVTVEVIRGTKSVGNIHLNALFLTMNKSGELPIYSEDRSCMGTVLIRRPNQTNSAVQFQRNQELPQNIEVSIKKDEPTKQIKKDCICSMSISTFLLIMKNSQQDDCEAYNTIRRLMDDRNDFEVIIRLNNKVYKFDNVVLHHSSPNDLLDCIEVRRSGGFSINCIISSTACSSIEVELTSSMRLLTYSQISLTREFEHCFATAISGSPFLHGAIHLKSVRLDIEQETFNHNRIQPIYEIIQSISDSKLVIGHKIDSQQTIKKIINTHHGIPFMQCKQFLEVLQPLVQQISVFQATSIKRVQTDSNITHIWKKVASKVMDECTYVDSSAKQVISWEDYQSIIRFYWQDYLSMLYKKEAQALLDSPVVDGNGQVIYAWSVAGYYLQAQQISNHLTRQPCEKPEPTLLKSKENQQNIEVVTASPDKPIISIEPSYFIESIKISKAHLLNNGKAPNSCLSLSKRVRYSNSNPEFTIGKEVTLQPIRVYHKDIKQDALVLLAEFKPTRRRVVYELDPSGNCTARINWGR